jgi:hypothetical protein
MISDEFHTIHVILKFFVSRNFVVVFYNELIKQKHNEDFWLLCFSSVFIYIKIFTFKIYCSEFEVLHTLQALLKNKHKFHQKSL